MIEPFIPPHLRAKCEFSPPDKPHYLNISDDGVHQRVCGWVKNRSGGGGHGVSLPERQNKWVCQYCLERRIKGFEAQSELL